MSAGRDETIDVAAALERMGGDLELLREVTGLFVEELPAHLESIGAAVAARDVEAVIRAAHALKGAAASLSASAVAHACEALENVCRDGLIDAMAEAWAALQVAVRSLQARLALLSPPPETAG